MGATVPKLKHFWALTLCKKGKGRKNGDKKRNGGLWIVPSIPLHQGTRHPRPRVSYSRRSYHQTHNTRHKHERTLQSQRHAASPDKTFHSRKTTELHMCQTQYSEKHAVFLYIMSAQFHLPCPSKQIPTASRTSLELNHTKTFSTDNKRLGYEIWMNLAIRILSHESGHACYSISASF
jgi:hypothetical protein